MKTFMRTTLVILALVGLALAAGCAPKQGDEGLVFGGSYRLNTGETLNHDLAVFGGSANLEKNSTVNGSVMIFGGSLLVDGEVNGDVAAFGGAVSLGEHAVVSGDVVTYGASVARSESAIVKGNIGSARRPIRPPVMIAPIISDGVQMISDFVWRIFQSFALAALAVLASLFILRPMERAGDALVAQPAVAGGMGLLTIIAAPVILVLTAVTIILSPLSLIGLFLLALAGLFGWLVLGLVTGERLGRWLNQEWSGPVSAGIGTLVLSLAMNLIGIIPCFGWLVVSSTFLVGLGSVVLTRFGMQTYPARPAAAGAAMPVEPVAAVGENSRGD